MGFLGLGDYDKPGKGVEKNAPQKKRFFQFFDIFGRKFIPLIKLNLLFLLFCPPAWIIPLFLDKIVCLEPIWLLICLPLCITIGPSMAAMTKICKSYVEEKPIFLWSDFVNAFRSNFKQGWIIGILDILLAVLMVNAFIFYWGQAGSSWIYGVLAGIVVMVALVAVFANFYIYLMMVSVDLKLTHLLKNSVMLAFLGMKTNFITLIFAVGILVFCVLFMPISIPLLFVLVFSSTTLITVFNSWQYIYRYLVRPYYLQTGKNDPYQKDETDAEAIFTDMTGKDAK